MAPNAAAVEDRGDVLGVGDITGGGRAQGAADQAADRLLSRLADIAARQQVIQRVGDKVSRRSRASVADTVLIIDSSAVADGASGIEDENLRCPPRAELIGDRIARIFQKREVDFVLARVMCDFGERVLLIRVDADQYDALRLILRSQLSQSRAILLCQ